MEITGKIIAVLPESSGVSKSSGNPWKSQDYVIETTQDQYPRKCCFRVFGEDKINQFAIKQDEQLVVSLDLDAHEYNGRWYNDVRAWKVSRDLQQPQPQAPAPVAPVADVSPFPPDGLASGNDIEDLPF